MRFTKSRVTKMFLASVSLMLMFSMMSAHADGYDVYMILKGRDGGSLAAPFSYTSNMPGTFTGDMNVRLGIGLFSPGQLFEKDNTTMRVWGGWGAHFIVPGFFPDFSNRFPGELYLEAAHSSDLLLCYGVTMPTPEIDGVHNNRFGSLCLLKWAEDGVTAYPVDSTKWQANGFMLSISQIDLDTGEYTIVSEIGDVEFVDYNPHGIK